MKIELSVNDFSIISQFIKDEDSLKAFESGHLQFLKELKENVEKKMELYVKEGKQAQNTDDFITAHVSEEMLGFLLDTVLATPLYTFYKKINEAKDASDSKPGAE